MIDPDRMEQGIRLGCGIVFGLILGGVVLIYGLFDWFGWEVAIMVTSAILCGYLSLKLGDRFWDSILERWSRWF